MEIFWRNKNGLIKLRDEFEKSKDPYIDYIDNYLALYGVFNNLNCGN